MLNILKYNLGLPKTHNEQPEDYKSSGGISM